LPKKLEKEERVKVFKKFPQNTSILTGSLKRGKSEVNQAKFLVEH